MCIIFVKILQYLMQPRQIEFIILVTEDVDKCEAIWRRPLVPDSSRIHDWSDLRDSDKPDRDAGL